MAATIITVCPDCGNVRVVESSWASPPTDGGNAWKITIECPSCLIKKPIKTVLPQSDSVSDFCWRFVR